MKDKPRVSDVEPLCPVKQKQSTSVQEQTDKHSDLSKTAIIHMVNFVKGA